MNGGFLGSLVQVLNAMLTLFSLLLVAYAMISWVRALVWVIQQITCGGCCSREPRNDITGSGVSTAAMSVLPMALLPGFFVPLFFIAHLAVLLQVRRLRAGVLAAA